MLEGTISRVPTHINYNIVENTSIIVWLHVLMRKLQNGIRYIHYRTTFYQNTISSFYDTEHADWGQFLYWMIKAYNYIRGPVEEFWVIIKSPNDIGRLIAFCLFIIILLLFYLLLLSAQILSGRVLYSNHRTA